SLGRKLLVDAGVTGPGALRDYLRSRGIHNLDVVVVTHPDKDHYGGLLDLPERFRIGQLLTPVTESPDPDFNALLTSLRARGTNITVVGKGTRLSGLGFEVQFLWPDDVTRNRFRLGTASTNDLSLVALVKHAEFRMLLTGDLDDPELLTSVAPRADLLKSPHHGSRKGNPVSLYEQVQPDYVLVMGRYPTPAKLGSRFAGTRVCYINTRSEGAVTLRFRGGTAQVQRFFPRPACAGE
ncbi:MBL fold metallo-hydrolase, partial [candidate division WOR-3 bacterium]|nr:MBL fold metallo-hydrolase [candidate division WOR-3 bacterium]